MSTIRKLRKNIESAKPPIIMFIGNPSQAYRIVKSGILPKIGEPIITVTDVKLYNRLLEGIKQAKDTKQHNVQEINAEETNE